MSDFPEDIMRAAREAYHGPFRVALDSAPVNEIVASVARAILAERERCLACQPSTAENPNEDAYQRGRFDGIMEFARAIAHPATPQEGQPS